MFNPPPADLHSREPLIYTAPADKIWFRCHQALYEPVYFGRARTYRWDAPEADYGVFYVAADERCAFMESIGRGILRTRFVSAVQLKNSRLAKVRFTRELRLVDFVASGGLTRLGADGSLTNSTGYRNSQRWSQALRCHPVRADGIYYRSRHDPALAACALYEQCQPFIDFVEDCGAWADHHALLGGILDHYQFATDL